MGDVSKGEGRTVLFVSHNMAAVRTLCNKGIVIENGLIKYNGLVEQALDVYSNIGIIKESQIVFDANTARVGNQKMQFLSVELSNEKGVFTNEFSIGNDINFSFTLKNNNNEKRSEVGIQIKSLDDMPIFHIMPRDSNYELVHNGSTETYNVTLKDIRLFPGIYNINITSNNTTGHEIFDSIENAISFEILDGGTYTVRSLPRAAGLIFLNPEWKKL